MQKILYEWKKRVKKLSEKEKGHLNTMAICHWSLEQHYDSCRCLLSSYEYKHNKHLLQMQQNIKIKMKIWNVGDSFSSFFWDVERFLSLLDVVDVQLIDKLILIVTWWFVVLYDIRCYCKLFKILLFSFILHFVH
jgi:hypothetical protein